MARDNARSNRPEQGKRGSGLFGGLAIGLLIGLLLAASLAWYLNSKPVFKSSTPAAREESKALESARATPAPQTAITPTPSAPAKMDYTFYGILPGEKLAKPKPIEPSSPAGDAWWLQVAALKNPVEADRLKAQLTLLGLHVATQKIHNNDQTLYRVRVGPYKQQDAAVADIDTLTENKIDYRLLKEPPKQ